MVRVEPVTLRVSSANEAPNAKPHQPECWKGVVWKGGILLKPQETTR